jgi:hypothetical protein
LFQPLEFKSVLTYEIPVYKKIKSNKSVHKYVGRIRLLTNGRIIKVKYEANSKAYLIPDEAFEECFVSATSNDSNNKLIKMIVDITNKTNESCKNYGYEIEIDIIKNVVSYMNIKGILKKAREAEYSDTKYT